jgi:BirA family biotin operon repressor/biotin-[acetyl-CoA-carboxylase] ligase
MKEQCESLDAKKIMRAICPENRHYLRRLELFDAITSTNSYLLTSLKTQPIIEKNGWVCLADEQTQGRGRQGKEWYSPARTNIYCSLTWCFPLHFKDLSALSIATAAMLIKALKNRGIKKNIGLKWPNDLLFAGRKLSGILLETLVIAEQRVVVLGIGLNLYLPEEKRKTWVGVEEVLGKTVSRNEMAGIVLDELFTGLRLFETQGLQPFLPLCREHDFLFGKVIQLQTPAFTFSGVAQGISDQGELLVLDQEKMPHRFCYGEVSVDYSTLEVNRVF